MRRLEMNLTQQAFAKRAGIALATYRRFEQTGEISLHNLILVSVPLGMMDDFAGLFTQRRYRSIDEVVGEGRFKTRKRGRRND
jgi:transcriptional regulator with XRE-family HTH domain